MMKKWQAEANARKEKCKLSRPGQPNPNPTSFQSSTEKRGWLFTEEVLATAPSAALFATGPHAPLRNKHCFYCLICQQNMNVKGNFRVETAFRARAQPESRSTIS